MMQRRHWQTGFERGISLVLIAMMILSQAPDVNGSQSSTTSAQNANPRKLNIVIIQGEGAINNVKQRLAREVIVQVNDENDRPVGGGAVAFLLPQSGPGGLFSNGTNALSVTTNAAGRATAQFVPNSLSGTFQINVSASFQGQVSTAVIQQSNAVSVASAAAGEAAAGAGTGTGISATTVVIIAAAVAGAIAVGVAAAGGNDDSPAPVQDGGPSIRIGAGGAPTVGTPGFQQPGRSVKPRPKWR